jgi:hypothetical protein
MVNYYSILKGIYPLINLLMKKILIGIVALAGLLLLIPKTSAGCDYDYSSSHGYDFLEVIWGKISLYDNKVSLNVEVRFSPESYQWACAYGFEPIRKNDSVQLICKISKYDNVSLKWKMADDMDEYDYEGVIVGKVKKPYAIDSLAEFLDNGWTRIKCNIEDNDTRIKVKVIDKRDLTY